MDFEFSPEQEKFRQEVRAFLNKELPEGWVDYVGTAIDDTVSAWKDGEQVFRDMAVKLGKQGWLSLFWPKECGGQACPFVDYLIFLEEMANRGSPGYNAIAVKMLAPTIFKFGNPEQKERHLPPIAHGEKFWCEGFTEPNAGSDIASLQTRAVKDGNDYIINGQKTWSTLVKYCDWSCVLARTDPEQKRHRGISFFLVDLKTPGITVSPIIDIQREPDFGEIFFEDVRVPQENLLGEENGGWQVVQTMLSYERFAIGPVAAARTMLDRLVKYIKDNPQIKWPDYKDKLAKLRVGIEVGRLFYYRLAWLHDNGLDTPYDAAKARLFGTELLQRVSKACMEILGLYGQLDKKDSRAPLKGWFQHLYLSSIGITIAAGTSEIQRNIISSIGLQMPRE